MAIGKHDAEHLYEMVHRIPLKTRAIEFWRKLDELGITFMQSQALRFVSRNEGCLMKGLAAEFTVSLAAITGIVDRLEGKDLLRRTADPGDRRALRLVLTAKGKKLMKRMEAEKMAWITRIMDTLQDNELRQVISGFEIFLKAATEYLSRRDAQHARRRQP